MEGTNGKDISTLALQMLKWIAALGGTLLVGAIITAINWCYVIIRDQGDIKAGIASQQVKLTDHDHAIGDTNKLMIDLDRRVRIVERQP